jgi:phytoene desaturase
VPTTHEHPNVDWTRERERYRRVVLDQLPKVGITDVERRIRFEKIVTPADWGARAIHRGAVFNLSHTMSQMLSFRPKNKFDELDGIFLVGGGTHPGSGLFTIFESARISVRQLLESRGMPTAWMEGNEDVPALPREPARYLAA